ncbi:uncharacterized protein Z520_02811 [Fonsecaea multimorphosa CBS 102226]|uniref:Transcription factor domain-containing protein n=1 Tax=Fonsecaea multimorphosa CBS 102226 TaxID=1442371 RepID=A0A0D2KWQ8_9EURO|nr:uncharacterized protein Z520_02811 [Fonsecaea multimorphosa CBS 102226]KIY01259.1 hypothetical protein Z520_02811 [Fonsecaea multimorphosa CBS 102226]OAL28538.1 hypothetical protein AYO22_02732 [Fonsecaea multimorphosa]
MSAKVSRPRKKRRANSMGRHASMTDSNSVMSTEASGGSPLTEGGLSMSSDASTTWGLHAAAHESPLPYQNLSLIIMDVLDNSNFVEQCFVEKFVELSTSSRLGMNPNRPRSWVFALPNLSSNTQTPSVKFSIRAASLIFFAVFQHNKSAEVEAVRWYLAGLESHRGLIQGCNDSGSNSLTQNKSTSSSTDISVPMMFLYFETMRRTSLDAWAHHIAAAVTIVEARGPDHYRIGHDHAMFRSLRTYAAFKALLKNDPCNFASPEWCEVPFTDSTKIPYEFLIDILLAVPHQLKLILVPGGDFGDSMHRIADLDDSDQQVLEKETLVLLQRLQNWWWHFTQDTGVYVGRLSANSDQDALDSLTIQPPVGQCVFPDTLTAKTFSLYNAMMVIVYSVLMALEERKPSSGMMSPIPRYRAEIERHSSSVLMAAWFQDSRHPYCGDALRTGFSLKIVSLLGADQGQKDEALRMMVSWGMESKIE